MIYLYVKKHNKTGLKYLGKTVSDPHTYSGSGLYWKRHLTTYGNDVTTEILKECKDDSEVEYWGKFYSDLWNVVDSDEWANLIPETGTGKYKGKNKIFTFYHINGESFTGTQSEFREKHPVLQQSSISTVVNGKQNSVGGWYTNKDKMLKPDTTQFIFFKPATSTIFKGTVSEMISTYSEVTRTGIQQIIGKTLKRHKGWFLG